MIIKNITLNNFRIYKGVNSIDLASNSTKNINIIAGKNGFGKTTFLTSLIWCFYGRLMVQVEEKYKKDIRNAGGYNSYLETTLNRHVKSSFERESFSVEVVLTDIFIPSIPCRTVTIRRAYSVISKEESLSILIDGYENELTKEVGYEVFINDFILPREIAKFFFFDAEKIVSLAEAKSISELRSLSKAYSEVLGIKKYEDLKKSLESLSAKLRRQGGSKYQKKELDELYEKESSLIKQLEHNQDKQSELDETMFRLKQRSDSLQEKLIREGNSITLDELKEIKKRHLELKSESKRIKSSLKDLIELAPFVIAGKQLERLRHQINLEYEQTHGTANKSFAKKQLELFAEKLKGQVNKSKLAQLQLDELNTIISRSLMEQLNFFNSENITQNILLEFSEEQTRKFNSLFDNIKTTYLHSFKKIVKEEKTNRSLLVRSLNKIKEAEARKNNPLAFQFRSEKEEVEKEIIAKDKKKEVLIEELGALRNQFANLRKVLSEYEKNLNVIEDDKKKYDVTISLINKVSDLIVKIKKEKRFTLQKSILLGLKKLMHKSYLIHDVIVKIEDDVMDVDLLDNDGHIIDKDTLSKGEQQLYATALLKALVDESGIKFPVFIDSPLQKFDKIHSENIIREFYPSISDQVVLFPLLEKELSEKEYETLKNKLNRTYLIHNENNNSHIEETVIEGLFAEFKNKNDVYTYSN